MIVCEINDYNDKIYNKSTKNTLSQCPTRGGIGETLNLSLWMQHFTDQKYLTLIKSMRSHS